MHYDYRKTYEKHARFYRAHPLAKHALVTTSYALTWLFIGVYAGFIVYGFCKKFGVWEMSGIIGLPLLCLIAVAVLRFFFHRPRPFSKNGAYITPFIQKDCDDNKSFPSRHLASAFVIASVFLPVLPWLSGVLYAFGGVMLYVRFALGLHYPSDLFFGALLGFVLGLPIWFFF